MHAQVMQFLEQQLTASPEHLRPGQRVLELGSRDINGSPRRCFVKPSYYLGIDCHQGPGVDRIGVVHEVLVGPEDVDAFDVVVSTEMLEHDPFWRQTLASSVALLRPGGLLMLSCASRLRGAHHLEDSPIPGHYEGLDPDDLLSHLQELRDWQQLRGWRERGGLDTFVVGKA